MGGEERGVRRPTSVDIARAAGVSQATVSRVVNGGSVSEATRRHVTEVMNRLGYQPNTFARSLITRRSGVVGVVVADVTNPFYPEMLEALGTRLNASGQRMLLQNAAVMDEQSLIEMLMRAGVDGAIFTTALEGSRGPIEMADKGYAVVLTNRSLNADVDSVTADNRTGAALAGQHLVDLGHRRIAQIHGHPDASTSRERAHGFAEALKRCYLDLDPRLQAFAKFDYEEAYSAARVLLSLNDPPTAVFCHNDLMALATTNAARSVGVEVPRDLSVVGFDDIRMASWETVRLTTISQPMRSMSDTAVQLLMSRLEDPEQDPRSVTFGCELRARGTTAPPASK